MINSLAIEKEKIPDYTGIFTFSTLSLAQDRIRLHGKDDILRFFLSQATNLLKLRVSAKLQLHNASKLDRSGKLVELREIVFFGTPLLCRLISISRIKHLTFCRMFILFVSVVN